MLEGKARVEDTDMPARMQFAATSAASRALDLFDVADCCAIAGHIKTEFDKRYGVGWQCVVGANFGCFFSHTSGTFIYFSLERLSFLLFKAATVSTAVASPTDRPTSGSDKVHRPSELNSVLASSASVYICSQLIPSIIVNRVIDQTVLRSPFIGGIFPPRFSIRRKA